MWNWITPENLVDLQRKAYLGHLGEQARTLLREGYASEADRLLDQINELREQWGVGPHERRHARTAA